MLAAISTSAPLQAAGGILSDYARLKPIAQGSSTTYWTSPAADFKHYDAVLLDPIRVVIAAGAATQPIDPGEIKMLTDYFREAIVREFAGGHRFVEQPGPKVLRARLVITELVPNSAEIGALVLIAPYGTFVEMAANALAGNTPGSAPYLGRAGLEIQFLDGETGVILAEVADSRAGSRLSLESGLEGAAASYAAGLSTWGYVKQAFDNWAKWMRSWQDELRGSRASTPSPAR